MSEEQPAATQYDNSVNNAVDGAADTEGTNMNDPANNNSSNDQVNNSSSNDAVDFASVYIDEKSSANNNSSNDQVNNSSSNDAVDFASVYIDEKSFFNGLQDEGKQLTPDEIKNETKKRGCIMHGQSYYKRMFDFSKQLYTHYKTQPDILPKLWKNDSKATHMIGQKLLEMRQTTTRADIHKVVTDGNQLE
eukprot:CAMPEP_0172520132 /NCGR_PEP_ID=MMETSP1066-20121228/291824_1 /TAXON_ID=671091 /ORGANISM="Coscinodiscus wailesii, Strain CCMP2513" /LENGTH=190 /DNA_ID=CAMNT_0013302839 /DNA_START=272 /DNA_END=844 /DNA_ORIENTATION=-